MAPRASTSTWRRSTSASSSDLLEVRGLRDLWALLTHRDPTIDLGWLPVGSLLDVLGLGLEQATGHLGQELPSWESFVAWVVTTAGPPDPDRVARWNAWCDGAPTPPAEVARQAALMAAVAADPVLDADEMATWASDGVVVLRSAITPDEAAAIVDHLWSVVGASPSDPASWAGVQVQGIMVQHFQHPAMEVPRRSARVAMAFAQLYGHADLIVSTDRLSLNPPVTRRPFPGPHLHWDTSLIPPIPFETGGILYLTDTTADQGALQVVPGFHHRLADGWLDDLGRDGLDPRTVDLSAEAVTVPAAAGDLVIWRQEIPHGASPNHTDRPRLAQYLTHRPLAHPDPRPWI